MKSFSFLLHGIVLALFNLTAIWAGFLVYHYGFGHRGPQFQIEIQLPAAFLLNALAFALWLFLAGKIGRGRLALRGAVDFAAVWLAALAAGPAIFVPLHYATQHYLTALSNVIGLWVYQGPVNMLLFAALGVFRGIRAENAKTSPVHHVNT